MSVIGQSKLTYRSSMYKFNIGLLIFSITPILFISRLHFSTYLQTKKTQVFNTTDIIIYNRVPKCGSTLIMKTFIDLSQNKNFRVESQQTPTMNKRIGPESHRFQSSEEEAKWQESIKIRKKPTIIIRHQWFSKFQEKRIKYINFVRDPIERSISGYYFMRYGREDCNVTEENPRWKLVRKFRSRIDQRTIGMNLDDCVKKFQDNLKTCIRLEFLQFFCGNTLKCKDDNDYALIQAKQNIAEEYSIVGYLENVEGFLKTLESKMPGWFGGVMESYKRIYKKAKQTELTKCKYQHPPKDETLEILRKKMWREVELYKFITDRFDQNWGSKINQ